MASTSENPGPEMTSDITEIGPISNPETVTQIVTEYFQETSTEIVEEFVTEIRTQIVKTFDSERRRKGKEKMEEKMEEEKKMIKVYDDDIRFSFSVKAARTLKRAIDALADPVLNSDGLATMEVGDPGFEITVQGETKEGGEIFGLLSLQSFHLTDFYCREPMERKISLVRIAQYLEVKYADVLSDDEVIIKIYCVDGSETLCFKFSHFSQSGQTRRDYFEIPFSDDDKPVIDFPNVTYGMEAVIPTDNLLTMVDGIMDLLPRRRPELVHIEREVSLKPGELSGVTVQELDVVWLQFPYWASLQMVSRLADDFALWLVTQPKKSVLFRFQLQGLGDFIYLKSGVETFFQKEAELPLVGTFRPLFHI